MIVCSCNILSDSQVRAIASGTPRLRMSQIYHSLGCAAECGRCGHTIKVIFEELGRTLNYASQAKAVGPATDAGLRNLWRKVQEQA